MTTTKGMVIKSGVAVGAHLSVPSNVHYLLVKLYNC